MSFRMTAYAVLTGLSMFGTQAFSQQGEWSTAGMTADRPALSYFASGDTRFVMTCHQIGDMRFHVKGFAAAQRWPQSALTVSFGEVERTKRPDLRLIGDRTSFEIEFAIADSVLESIARGLPVKARFDEQEQLFPVPPEAMRREFARKCAALVPAGMRKG
ncbi:hypothetical protein [Variovorax saccharolyticus]|uniref:hypothetical protein n=1 Tax=Variovorax saccharolyticus TaxID=3053516 RepID=UPI0025772FF8|nr:hypothetical protein [Variovorax sp. J22R187]MDM0022508.1 hypothetical protein [Variovorax sp. J22R187]